MLIAKLSGLSCARVRVVVVIIPIVSGVIAILISYLQHMSYR